jgi:CO/xanthine dehydrogenase FAD-binding subunit
MITEYHRPKDINDALTLLSRDDQVNFAMGGGTILNQEREENYAVVDLQDLGLDTILHRGNQVQIGATVTLQELLRFPGMPEDFYNAIERESTYNIRQMATVAGKMVSAGGRSSFLTVMLSLDASLEVHAQGVEPESHKLGDWLALRPGLKHGYLITRVTVPINIKLAFETIARTPDDVPIVCASVTRWDSGRTRLALGGWGLVPILAMDGPSPDGIEIAAKNAYSLAADEWAGAEYRQEMAGILSLRCLQRINSI